MSLRAVVFVFGLICSAQSYPSSPSPCPEDCQCIRNDLICDGASLADVVYIFNSSFPENLLLLDCDHENLDLNIFENATALKAVELHHCDIEKLYVSDADKAANPQVQTVDLSNNNLEKIFGQIDFVWPNLEVLDLRYNQLQRVQATISAKYVHLARNELEEIPDLSSSRIEQLDLTSNEILRLNGFWPQKLQKLNISGNKLSSLSGTAFRGLHLLKSLDLTHNEIESIEPGTFSNLSRLSCLNLSSNPLESIAQLSPNLSVLSVTNTNLRFANLTRWRATGLATIDLSTNPKLQVVFGRLSAFPRLRKLNFGGCALHSLPVDFLDGSSVDEVILKDNPWLCDCQLLWVLSMPRVHNQTLCATNLSQLNALLEGESCQLGSSLHNSSTVRVRYGTEVAVHCQQFGDVPPSVTWSRLDQPDEVLAVWDAGTQRATVFSEDYRLIPGGILLVPYMSRDYVETYKCTTNNTYGNASRLVALRLDLSYWNIDVKAWSIVCAIFTCMAFFALNMIWAAIRRLMLWRLNRMERTSRLRKMIEAMEKYRERQYEQLSESYQRKVNLVRENYRLQTEQLRSGYAQQCHRFRDYRAAQMESAHQYVENVRDNYSAQIGRVREYGSRRMESLYESYQRQMNRIRTFSLQQRLRLMRQYKIKQRYLNKVLEGLELYWTGDDNIANGQAPHIDIPPLDDPPSLDAVSETDSMSSYHSFQMEMEIDEQQPSTSRVRGVTVGSDDSYKSTETLPHEESAL